MCMLSFYPEGIQPDRTRLLNGADLNPDGHGYAIVTRDRKLMVRKSMNSGELIEAFIRARHDNPDGPALFHSRIATCGLVDITGCHPFKVGQDNRTVVAHNGILFKPADGSLKSDTAIFAELMLPRFGSLDSGKKRRKLERWTGRGNKLVILTVNPARRETAYLVNASAGIWTHGEWHSNYDYKGTWWKDENYVAGFANGQGRTGKPKVISYGKSVFPCEVCGAMDSVNMADGICDVCASCNDCHAHWGDCLCYTPRTVRTHRSTCAIAMGTSPSS